MPPTKKAPEVYEPDSKGYVETAEPLPAYVEPEPEVAKVRAGGWTVGAKGWEPEKS